MTTYEGQTADRSLPFQGDVEAQLAHRNAQIGAGLPADGFSRTAHTDDATAAPHPRLQGKESKVVE